MTRLYRMTVETKMEVEDLILPEQNKTIVTGAIPVDIEEDNEEPCCDR